MTTSARLPAAELSYDVHGTGPALVLAHGAGGSAEANWGGVIAPLAETCTVVSVDFPGAGATPPAAGPLMLDRLADQLVDAATEAAGPSFALVGFSLSCAVAVRAAVRHPQRIRALVLIGGFAHADAHLRLVADLWEDLLDLPARTVGRFLTLVALSPAARGLLTEQARDEQAELAGAALAPGTRAHLDLLRRVDVRADLPRVGVRTLVVGLGADDVVLPSNQRALRDAIPGAEYAELDSGHLAMAERPDELVATLRGFLA